jgi:16S rRNA (guanine966-N2)-methyltransferase
MTLRIYGNRQLKTLPGQDTRPTIARVRAALFNIWQGTVLDCRWLDLCTGTGSMGAEALCRGASVVIGIEQSARACRVIQQNWQQVAQLEQQFHIIRGNVLDRLPNLPQAPFDRIYFDPPYASDLYQPVLELLSQCQLLAPGGEVAVEHSRDRQLPDTIASLELWRQKFYGNTGLTFYRMPTLQQS